MWRSIGNRSKRGIWTKCQRRIGILTESIEYAGRISVGITLGLSNMRGIPKNEKKKPKQRQIMKRKS